ncbi:Regulator of microtubule dynamics protein 2, partial [Toxocara canis]
VANLSWLQRTVATELFGVPPTATADEALADLLKAEELNPGQLDNLLFIAKCYLAKGSVWFTFENTGVSGISSPSLFSIISGQS